MADFSRAPTRLVGASLLALFAFYAPPDKADAARREDSALAARLIKAGNIRLTN